MRSADAEDFSVNLKATVNARSTASGFPPRKRHRREKDQPSHWQEGEYHEALIHWTMCRRDGASDYSSDRRSGPGFQRFAAEEGCIVTEVAYHVRGCPPGVAFAVGGNSSDVAEPTATAEPTVTPTATVEPTVTPTAAPPEGCIKTDVSLHARRCPAGF